MKLSHELRRFSTPHGAMRLLVLRPKEQKEALPGILWIHGGGYCSGFAEMAYFSCGRLAAERCGAVLLAPEYRLSWQAPYPAALADCYRALLYMKTHADELGIRSDQLMVGGESAGGGLAAALCMLAHDRGEVNIAFQTPLYPMLDCFDTASSAHNHFDPTWGTLRNHAAWRTYLGKYRDRQGVPAYASPARRRDLAGLPPCYSFVCRDEPFHDETVNYISALQKAGVAACIDVYPGNFHAFDMLLPWTQRAKAARAAFCRQFEYAAEHYFAPQ